MKYSAQERFRAEELQRELSRRLLIKSFTQEGGLMAFVRHFWHILEPQTPLVEGWVMEAICIHLEAVSRGEINRLLINVPPGFSKSLLTDVFWPAWEWAVIGAHLRYVAFSYSASLTQRDNRRFHALVSCREYQELFGDKITLAKIGEQLISNTATGWKLASSVGGVSTGERGDRIILDDPHNVIEAESKIEREKAVRWFRESMTNRLNDMEAGAIVIIMQRLHYDDVSGVILENGMDYCHLCVTMEFEYERVVDEHWNVIRNQIGWYDQRFDEYDVDRPEVLLAWPERFPPHIIEKMKNDGGPYAWAGQYQQSPIPRGGGIFKRAWWQVWEAPDGRFPTFEYLLASVDSAFTKDQRNDPTALSIWGVFRNKEDRPRVMLVHAWRKHLAFSAGRRELEPIPGESKAAWVNRTQASWGLVEWIKYSCERFKVDNLLIEGKASGLSAAQELENRYGRLNFGIQKCPVKGDKEARALSVQWVFSSELVYAPVREWAEETITEMETFPLGRYDDLTDSATQAIRFIVDNDLLRDDAETDARGQANVFHIGKKAELTFW